MMDVRLTASLLVLLWAVQAVLSVPKIVKLAEWKQPPANSRKKYFGASIQPRAYNWDQLHGNHNLYGLEVLQSKYLLPLGKLEAFVFYTDPKWGLTKSTELWLYIFVVDQKKTIGPSGVEVVTGYSARVVYLTKVTLTSSQIIKGYYSVNITDGPIVEPGSCAGFAYLPRGVNVIAYDFEDEGSTKLSGVWTRNPRNKEASFPRPLTQELGQDSGEFVTPYQRATYSFGVLVDVIPQDATEIPTFTTAESEDVAFNVADTATWPWWLPVTIGIGILMVVILFVGLAVVIHRCTETGDNTEAIVKAISESMMAGMQASMMNQALAASFDPMAVGMAGQPQAMPQESEQRSKDPNLFMLDQLNDVTKEGYDVNVVIELNRPAKGGKDGQFKMKKRTGKGGKTVDITEPDPEPEADTEYTEFTPEGQLTKRMKQKAAKEEARQEKAEKKKKKKKKAKLLSAEGGEEEQTETSAAEESSAPASENEQEPETPNERKSSFSSALSSLLSFGRKSKKSAPAVVESKPLATEELAAREESQAQDLTPSTPEGSAEQPSSSGAQPDEAVVPDSGGSEKKKKKKKKKGHVEETAEELAPAVPAKVESVAHGKPSELSSPKPSELKSPQPSALGGPKQSELGGSRQGATPSGLSNYSGILQAQDSNVEGVIQGRGSNVSKFDAQQSTYSTAPGQASATNQAGIRQGATPSALSSGGAGAGRQGATPSGMSNYSGVFQSQESNVEGLVGGKESAVSKFGGQESSYSTYSPVAGQPSEMKGKPSEMKGKPSEMKGKPSEMKGKPSEMKGKPSEMKGKASEMAGQNTLSGTTVGADRQGATPSGMSNYSGVFQSQESNVEGLVGGKESAVSKFGGQESSYSTYSPVAGQPSEMKGKQSEMKGKASEMKGKPSATAGGGPLPSAPSALGAQASGISPVGSNVSGYSNIMQSQESNISGIVGGKESNVSSFGGGAVGSSISGMPSNVKGMQAKESAATTPAASEASAANADQHKGKKKKKGKAADPSEGTAKEPSGLSLKPDKSGSVTPSDSSVSDTSRSEANSLSSSGSTKKKKKKGKDKKASESSKLSTVPSSNEASFSDFAQGSDVDWPSQKH